MKGDIDFNGTLNSTDVQMIQEYVIHSRTFSDVEKFYADVNGDGSVNNTDAYVLNQIIGGYI